MNITYLLCTLCLLLIAAVMLHIASNESVPQTTRKWFQAVLFINALYTAAEIGENLCFDLQLSASHAASYVFVFLQLTLLPFLFAAYSMAFEKEKTAKVLFALALANTVGMAVLMPQKLVFSIAADGSFVSGPLHNLWSLLQLVFFSVFIAEILMLGLHFGKKANQPADGSAFGMPGQNMAIPVITILISVISMIYEFVTLDIYVMYLPITLNTILIWFYYESMLDKQLIEEIREKSRLIREMSEARVREENERRIKNEEMTDNIIRSFSSALDAKDRYTNGHAYRVAEYSVIIARALGWEEADLRRLRYEGLLHDVGKIAIPDSVLNKAGRLDDVEFGIIKSHTLQGEHILKAVDSENIMQCAAAYHHERYDGRGYPRGIKGDNIPLDARIIGIADSYDAMNSDRVYRKALPKAIIREEIVKGRGTQFDPGITDVFLQLFDAGKLDVPEPESEKPSPYRKEIEQFFETIRAIPMIHTGEASDNGAGREDSQAESAARTEISVNGIGQHPLLKETASQNGISDNVGQQAALREETADFDAYSDRVRSSVGKIPGGIALEAITIHVKDGCGHSEELLAQAMKALEVMLGQNTNRIPLAGRVSKTQYAAWVYNEDMSPDYVMADLFSALFKNIDPALYDISYKCIFTPIVK